MRKLFNLSKEESGVRYDYRGIEDEDMLNSLIFIRYKISG